jgi:hypothetical protein
MALPIQQTSDLDLSLVQKTWSAQLNPILANPSTNPGLLSNIILVTGSNVINHKLGRKMQGWKITDIDSAVTVYRPDTSPFNDLTLTLVSSGMATISLEVF